MSAILISPLDDPYNDIGATVVFAPSILHAAAEFTDELAFFEFSHRPEWDKYEATGFTCQAMVEEGWTVPCRFCEQDVNDEYDRDGELRDPTEPVYDKRNAYCSQQCKDAQAAVWHEYAKRKALTSAVAIVLFGPDIDITYASGSSRSGWCKCKQEPHLSGMVEFRFPGSKGKVNGCPHCRQFGVTRRDLAAWKTWRKLPQAD
ncbi:MAG: hypothetical protein GY903_01025 [Fuerstiella sp.]|nr:hypothetical protein [Fuerstiella sp.]MCP4853060.1 hypothetical protein [Fuerstiella sp.]